jgi:hypothetical protein
LLKLPKYQIFMKICFAVLKFLSEYIETWWTERTFRVSNESKKGEFSKYNRFSITNNFVYVWS